MPAGAKPGERRGGRAKGVRNKVTVARLNELKASGEVPLDYMLRIMRDPSAPNERRDQMAISAARFCHPTLASVEAQHSGNLLVTHEQALNELDE